ncbi:MAG TPA: carboxypeptidase-like regulatory domain-containing protein [Vicinamibacterales bacterium]|nr:carboxypeptidase-like regulatory domain-containing protein [Vicinamibacterales bacterium]
MVLTVAAVAVVLLAGGACRRLGAVNVDTLPAPPGARATINGVVRGPEDAGPMAGRTIEAIDMRTGGRVRAVTNPAGGFTLELPPGHYRVDVSLHDGEVLLARPGAVELARDADRAIEFLIGPSRTSHPHGPAYRVDNGLGSPIA